MILGPPESVGYFLKNNWRKKPGSVQIPLDRILPLMNSFDGVSPEVLFDRAARLDRDSISALGEAPPKLLSNSPIAWWATCEYEKKHAIEVKGVQRNWDEITQFMTKLQDELATPMLSGDCSILALPKGFEKKLALDTDTFFLLVRGSRIRVAGLEPQLGGLMYFPRESPVALKSPDDCILLRIRLNAAPAFRFIFDQLVMRLRPQGGWSEPLGGVLGFGDAHELSCQQLDRLLDALREELTGLDSHKLLEAHVHSPGAPPAERAGGQFMAAADSTYEDLEWGIENLPRRKDDIYISTYRRSGTTWLQMILYQLFTDGDLGKIDHIYQYSPYPIYELKITGSSERIEKLPGPRVIKTHLPFEWIYSQQGKYISVLRDGMDVALSGFHHHYEVGNGPIPLDVYFDRFLMDRKGWFHHVEGWWNNRDKKNVLLLTYRSLAEDPEGTILKIADFVGSKPSPADLQRIVQRSSFEYMKEHEAKFHHNEGVQWMMRSRESAGFIRSGKLSEGKATLSDDQRRRFRARYKAKLGQTDLNLDK